jgi:hypothetical protein
MLMIIVDGTLVTEIRRRHPGAGILTTPEAANTASRRVLERNGFDLESAGVSP